MAIFVTFATLLLLAGLTYYVYHLAETKGWFLTKVHYSTCLNDASGLKEGQPVMLLGFAVGEITKVEANKPWDWYNVTVNFVVHEPYYGYVWTDSRVRVGGLALLGPRTFEILKGKTGVPTVEEEASGPRGRKLPKTLLAHDKVEQFAKNLAKTGKKPEEVQAALKQAVEADRAAYSTNSKAVYWLPPEDAPALQDRLESILATAEAALPNILELTNQLTRILTNVATATEQVNGLLVDLRPALTNLHTLLANVSVISGHLREPKGSLGEWVLPTNLNHEVTLFLTNLNGTMTNVNTNLVTLVESLNQSLENLAGITGNLHSQVDANTNLVSNIASALVHTDDLIQGLKRHWLLRGAFKNKPDPTATNTPPPRSNAPVPGVKRF